MDQRRFCTTARVIIVAGKGGVGKTTVVAALAVVAARSGLSVLIAEVEGKSGLSKAFGVNDLEYEEIVLSKGISARTLTPDAALSEWLQGNGLGRIARRLNASGILEIVATAVPGMKDILVLGKIKALEQSRAFDLILVDAPAAGHAVSFLTSPLGLLEAVGVGPIKAQASDVVAMLSDPTRAQVMLVTTPEETPVREAIETAFALEDRVGVALGPIIVNGIYTDDPAIASENDLTKPGVFDHAALEASISLDAQDSGFPLSSNEIRDIADAVSFRHARRQVQSHQADELRDALPIPQLRLPYLFDGEIGFAQIEKLADALGAQIEMLPDPIIRGPEADNE
ncbi:MAG: AAA family ATPase [Actinobacteria bacterium]|nr:AAA family ATPase [Actinomycetota bacterium]